MTAAAAMNVGLASAANDLILRADAHTLYAPDYVERSVAARAESGADWIGGPMRAIGTTSFGRAVAAVTSSPFGVGPGAGPLRDRGDRRRDRLPRPVRPSDRRGGGRLRRDAAAVGGRGSGAGLPLRRAGRRIRLDPTIRSWYFPRQTPDGLWRQYVNYGMCKASTLKKHRRLPYWRPVAPAFMVAAAAAWTAIALGRRRPVVAALPAVSYTLGAGAVSLRIADDPGVAPHRAAAVLRGMSTGATGSGSGGLGRIATGRPFDVRPRSRS